MTFSSSQNIRGDRSKLVNFSLASDYVSSDTELQFDNTCKKMAKSIFKDAVLHVSYFQCSPQQKVTVERKLFSQGQNAH